MTIEDIKSKKMKLEEMIENLIAQFEKETGLIVTNIVLQADFNRNSNRLYKTTNSIITKIEI